jgi:hypothetical protein
VLLQVAEKAAEAQKPANQPPRPASPLKSPTRSTRYTTPAVVFLRDKCELSDVIELDKKVLRTFGKVWNFQKLGPKSVVAIDKGLCYEHSLSRTVRNVWKPLGSVISN